MPASRRTVKKPAIRSTKAKAIKSPQRPATFQDDKWTVVFGKLKPGPGRPKNDKAVIQAFGEKLPRESLSAIEKKIAEERISPQGVYFAHDTFGCARYAGRGNVFGRLRSRFKAHPNELFYFSFYLIANKQYEREIETVLIRVASHLLVLNDRKKRDDIAPGNVRDYEAGTIYFERQGKRGPIQKKRRT